MVQTALNKVKTDVRYLDALLNSLREDLEDGAHVDDSEEGAAVATPASSIAAAPTSTLPHTTEESSDSASGNTSSTKADDKNTSTIQTIVSTLEKMGLYGIFIRASLTSVAIGGFVLHPLNINDDVQLLFVTVVFFGFMMAKVNGLKATAKTMKEGHDKKTTTKAADWLENLAAAIVIITTVAIAITFLNYATSVWAEIQVNEREAQAVVDVSNQVAQLSNPTEVTKEAFDVSKGVAELSKAAAARKESLEELQQIGDKFKKYVEAMDGAPEWVRKMADKIDDAPDWVKRLVEARMARG